MSPGVICEPSGTWALSVGCCDKSASTVPFSPVGAWTVTMRNSSFCNPSTASATVAYESSTYWAQPAIERVGRASSGLAGGYSDSAR